MRKAGSLLIAVLFIQMSLVSLAQSAASTATAKDWSRVVVESTVKHYPTAADLGSWGYAKALYLFGEYLVWKRTGDSRYLQETFKVSAQPASVALLSSSQSSTPPASGVASNTNPQSSDAVKYFSSAEVHAAFEKGSPLINKDGRTYWVTAGKRDKPGQSELHEKDTDVFYVLQGSATFVTGGKMLEPKSTAPGEVRGSGIEGGETHTLSKDDVIIIPAGVPHWFKDVQGTFLYFVVKVQ